MKIKIKRATTKGLKENKGYLFETNGMQFCLVNTEGTYFSIELSTGCNVKSFDPNEYSKKTSNKIGKTRN